MAELKIVKSIGVPDTVAPDTLYLCSEPEAVTDLTVVVTDTTGTVLKRTVNQHDLSQVVGALISKSDQPQKTSAMTQRVGIDEAGGLWASTPSVSSSVKTFYLPNVGDSATIRLGEQIVLVVTKTSNSGNETYKSELTAFSENRLICYRRDSVFDNSSTEGSNGNNFIIVPGAVNTLDSTIYGSMRDFARVTFVDMTTLESWIVRKWHFGQGYFRAVIEHHVDPDIPSEQVPLPPPLP